MIWAPLQGVSHVAERKSGVGREERSLPSLGEGHPEDEDELEGVVEGWGRISATLRAGYLGDLRNQ